MASSDYAEQGNAMSNRQPPTISNLPPRLAATFALIPISFGVAFIAVLAEAMLPWNLGEWYGLSALILPVLVFHIGGQAIWWGTVDWTFRRRLAVFGANLVWFMLLVSIHGVMYFADEGAYVYALLVTLIASPAILLVINRVCWSPPRHSALVGAVPCPRCGHDLRGEGRCGCGECHTEFTLAELVESTRVARALNLPGQQRPCAHKVAGG